jgi:hypothetical protein
MGDDLLTVSGIALAWLGVLVAVLALTVQFTASGHR